MPSNESAPDLKIVESKPPKTPFTPELSEAFISVWTELKPCPEFIEDLTKAERDQLLKTVAKTREAKAKLENRGAYKPFENDDPDSQIRDYILENGELSHLSTVDWGRVLYGYDQRGFWSELPDESLSPQICRILDNLINDGYNGGKLKNIVSMVRELLPKKPDKQAGLIGFKNGVFSTVTRDFLYHSPEHGLSNVADYTYNPEDGDCPNFENWLEHSCAMYSDCKELDINATNNKRNLIMAALFMVATNQFSWQLYLEVFGAGGTGKSLFLKICEMLVGSENRVSLSLDELECTKTQFGLENAVGKSLIVCPDVKKMASDFNNLKAITGGDSISIQRKCIKSLTLDYLPAIVVITGNQPMASTDQSTGLWRRRIVIPLNNIVSDTEKDPLLEHKIKHEVAAIFNKILNWFPSTKDCLDLLRIEAKSEAKLEAAEDTDPLLRWVKECLNISDNYTDLVRVGGYDSSLDSNRTNSDTMLQHLDLAERLYPNYKLYCKYIGVKHPLALNNFSSSLETLSEKMEKYRPIKKTKNRLNHSGFIGIKININAPHFEHMRETIDKNKYRETNI